jgi:hypothetical protein
MYVSQPLLELGTVPRFQYISFILLGILFYHIYFYTFIP